MKANECELIASQTGCAETLAEPGVQRVVAEAMAVNLASRRVMEKAGLTLVRTFRRPWPYPVDGDKLGDVEYALTKADWEKQG